MSTLILVTGGVKSGKSRLATRCLETLTATPTVLATARRTDAEMSKRIDRHIADRPSHWTTIEEPLEVPTRLREEQRPLLLDCLGVWLTNVLIETPDQLSHAIDDFVAALSERTEPTVIVSNETSLGVIGADALTRKYVDQLGLLNQRIAALADHTVMTLAGLPLWLTDPFIISEETS